MIERPMLSDVGNNGESQAAIVTIEQMRVNFADIFNGGLRFARYLGRCSRAAGRIPRQVLRRNQ